MRQPSVAFYVALLFLLHFFGIKFAAFCSLCLAIAVSVGWRLLCQYKLQVSPPENAAAFVTGASSGIGQTTALEFAKRGLVVFAGVRKLQDGDQLVKLAGKNGKLIVPVICDVCDTSSVNSAAKTVAEEIRRRNLTGLFCLGSIAGVMPYSAVEVVSDEKNRQTFEVNYFGVVRTIQAFVPLLREFTARSQSRQRAHIVLVSSMGGLLSGGGFSPYAPSKFAVEALADSLRGELAEWNIWTSVFEFGAVESNLADALNKETYDPQSLYFKMHTAFRNLIHQFRAAPATAQDATWQITTTVFGRFPASRVSYSVPLAAVQTYFLIFLPDTIRDFVYRKALLKL